MSDPARNPAASEPSWVLRLWRSPWPWMAIVLVFFCVPLFSGLDHTDLENDEAIYAFAVETMLEDGDWLTPKSIPSKTSAFLEKPPLKFWLNALPIQFGWAPASASGMRVTDAVLASLAFLYVFGIGRRLRGPVCGLVAVFLMFIDQRLLFEHGLRGNNMESALLLAYAGGIYHFLAWRSVNPDMKRHVYAMALWFVLGFMTKFVAAIFLPAILAVAVMIRREDRARLYRDWPTFAGAAAVALALILPWFVYQYFARGPRLIEIMFSGHVVKRFTVYLDPAHLQPWHFYLTDLWRSLSPTAVRWLLMLGVTAVAWRTLRRRWVEGALVLVWFALPVAVISTGTSKVYHYLYPFLPALYLCSGYVVAYAAELAYRWLRAPVEYFDALRSRGMPGALRSGIAERSATAFGVVAWFIALATAAFDRIRLAFPAGDLTIRNSSVWRPAAGGALILLAAAPASILRAALVAVLALLALPIEGFEQTVDRTSRLDRPLAALRECARPISDRLANEGRRGPAIWSDAALSYIPIYYFGDFGPWQRATEPSTASTLEWLLYRPARIIVLGQPQWETLQDELATGRRDLLARLAATTGPDPTVDQRLRDAVLGLVRHQDILLLLPGPLSACGTELVPLVSR